MRLRLLLTLMLAIAIGAGSLGLTPRPHVASATAPPPPQPLAQITRPADERTGDVIVRFRAASSLAGVASALDAAGSRAKAAGGSGVALVHPDADRSVDDAIAALRADPSVESAEADVMVSAAATPNDTYYAGYQWGLPQIGAPTAWDVTTGGSPGVIVAVVDTGVDPTHPDLSGKLTTGPNAGANFVTLPISTSSNASGAVKITLTSPHAYQTGDQVTISGHLRSAYNGTWTITSLSTSTFSLNGSVYTPFPAISTATSSGGAVLLTTASAHGLSSGNTVAISGNSVPAVNGSWTVTVLNATQFTLNGSAYSANGSGGTIEATGGTALNASTRDDNSHGTFVSGIIGANSNNGAGMAGVCWTCKIMPVKVLDNNGSGSSFSVSLGIDWAVAHGAKVINLSLGAGSGIAQLQTSVDNAWAAGAIVVAASGNDNGPVLFPAAYPNAIAVGSSDPAGNRSSFSNYGPELDVMAPGSGTETSPGVWASDVLGTLCTCAAYTGGYGTGRGTSFASPHVAGVVALMIASGITNKDTIVSRLKSTATEVGAAGFDNLTGFGRVNVAAAVASTDTTGPTVAITSPANATIVSGSVNFSATASDPAGVQKVRFWVDSTYLGYDTTAPYAKTWDTSTFSAGAHTLKAEAFDNLNNISSVTISVTVTGGDTTPPAAAITAPANGATVSGSSAAFTATATDAGGVSKVRFWVDGTYLGYDSTSPYAKTWDTTAFANGPHTLKIEAFDNAANLTTQTVAVTVSNTDAVPPSVTLTAPANAATVSGTVNIAASATDNLGVSKVRFWVDGTYLGYDSTAPYGKSWDSTSIGNGSHVLSAQSVDQAGNLSVQASVNITVSN